MVIMHGLKCVTF